VQYCLWDKQEGHLFTDLAASGVIGGMILTQAFTWNVRTCRYDAKRKLQAADAARRKVSKHSTGAEHPVVVEKFL